jgi:pimeloyl-ACP methyl ester carboxylesterase
MDSNNKTIPVTFPNRDGLTLFGIVHEPLDYKGNDTGVIILSPGVKGRVAPHRLYIKMARLFADMGYATLRFDFYGLGDSEGTVDEKYLADFYQSVQLGRYTEDTIAAMDWMEKNYGFRKFILAGLCGGAITGLHTGAKDHRVVSLIALGLPVVLDGLTIDRRQFLTKAEMAHSRWNYMKRLLSFSSWVRFLSLKSDYSLLLRSFLKPKRSEKTVQIDALRAETLAIDLQRNSIRFVANDNFNPFIPELFESFIVSRKILLVFSEADRLFWEFEEKYAVRYKKTIKRYQKNLEVHVVSHANHIFSFIEWQEDMFEIVSKWLTKTKQ